MAAPGSEEIGRWGEEISCAFLRLKGYRIIDRNCRVGRLELDAVAMDGTELVFVEVKVRRRTDRGGPLGSVGFKKQRHLIRAAARYMSGKRLEVGSARFDVVAVVVDGAMTTMALRHIKGAFVIGGDMILTV